MTNTATGKERKITSSSPTPDRSSQKSDPSIPGTIIGPMRLPFLVLTPVCVSLGLSTALWQGYEISLLEGILVFIGAIAAHISVNALNEYDDFRTGLDTKTDKTPFSGGSGALPHNPKKAVNGLMVGLTALAVTIFVGGYFLYGRGMILLPIGIVGVLVIVTYTPLLTKSPLLCLLAPGIGFGPCMVLGTHVALTGEYTAAAAVTSALSFFLVSNLLLLNQFPDTEADRTVGRRHIPIVWGKRKATWLYSFLLLGAFLSILSGYMTGLLPTTTLLSLVMVIPAGAAVVGVFRYARNTRRLIPFMGINVLVALLTPLLTTIGLLLKLP